MHVGPHIDALRADLEALAAVGDDATRDAAARLGDALEPTVGLRFLELLTDAAREVSAQLPSGHVEVRLPVSEPSLVYVEEEPAAAAPRSGAESDTSARITLRLSESLKVAIERAASAEALSVNAWLVRELSRAVSPASWRVGHRLTGFAKS